MISREQAAGASMSIVKTVGGAALGAVVGVMAVTAITELGWLDKWKGLFSK